MQRPPQREPRRARLLSHHQGGGVVEETGPAVTADNRSFLISVGCSYVFFIGIPLSALCVTIALGCRRLSSHRLKGSLPGNGQVLKSPEINPA